MNYNNVVDILVYKMYTMTINNSHERLKLMQATYRGRVIEKTAEGYEVGNRLFSSLTGATEWLDRVSVQ